MGPVRAGRGSSGGPRGEFPGTDLARLATAAWRESGRAHEIPIEGRSMAPTLAEGRRVWFRPPGERGVRRGDILVYADRAGLVVHRVVGCRADGRYRTKGDGRATFDTRRLPPDDVGGRVFAVERRRGIYSLDGPGPRAYATAMAAFSNLVGGVARLASTADGVLRRMTGGRTKARPASFVVGHAAQAVARVADGLLFTLLHATISPSRGIAGGASRATVSGPDASVAPEPGLA